jgi:hypothetical protein
LARRPKKTVKAPHGHKRLQNDPGDAYDGLLVADLDVAPHEEIEEFTICPEFAEAKFEKAALRLDADRSGGAGTERERGIREAGDVAVFDLLHERSCDAVDAVALMFSFGDASC